MKTKVYLRPSQSKFRLFGGLDTNTHTYANDNDAPAANLSTETTHLVSSETSLHSNTENSENTDPNIIRN